MLRILNVLGMGEAEGVLLLLPVVVLAIVAIVCH